jgi:Squalene-hopene cyclase N-terminal domain
MFSSARGSRRPWRPAALSIVALAAGAWSAQPASAGTLARALDHLATVQDPRGGGFAEGRGTDPSVTTWAALAVAAAPGPWAGRGVRLRRALVRTLGPALADAERGAVALAASGIDPRAAAGRDLAREILAAQRPDGSIGADASTTAWGILALRAARLTAEAGAVLRARDALERRQRPDGGWALAAASPGSGPNTTADVVQALVAAGRRPQAPSLVRARRFLRSAQNADGGFPAVVGGSSTALTTAWVALALRSLRERGSRPPWNRGGGPRGHLARLQRADGAVRNTRAGMASVWATSQTALAFSGRPLPILAPATRAARRR